MRTVERKSRLSANDCDGTNAAKSCGDEISTTPEPFGVRIDIDPGWFCCAAQKLYPSKGGTELHYLTDYDERLCQKYVAGSVRPSAYFLRTLLRGPHGAQWLAALMDGCTAPWWREHQRAAEVGRKVLDITK